MAESEEEEETILEYAEYHKLASDCRANESMNAEVSLINEYPEPLSLDDSALYQIPHIAPLFSDIRLILDKDSAVLLRSVNQHREEHDPWAEIAKYCRSTRRNAKRLDSLLLKTDPEADLAAFKARAQQPLKPEDEFLPAEPLDQEDDQGLEWPSKMLSLSTKKMAELEKEKVPISKADILFAVEALKDDWADTDERKLLESHNTYQRTAALDPITPPLSPILNSDFEPFVPSSPGCVLPLLSDPESLLGADQEEVEQRIFDDDTLVKNGSSSQPDIDADNTVGEPRHFSRPEPQFEELESLPSDEIFPAIDRNKKGDLQIDSGLTPPMPAPTYPKSVTFSDHVDTMLLDDEYSDEASSRADSRSAGVMAWDLEVEGVLKAASEKVNQKLEREQLQEAATTKKVEVPTLAFPSPCLPWKEELQSMRSTKKILNYQGGFISDALDNNFMPAKVHGLHRLQESLRWAPFPADLARVALLEDLERGEAFDSLLALPSNVTTSQDVIFSKDVIRCLEERDDDDHDDELEAAEFENSPEEEEKEDLNSLLQRRKRQLNSDARNGDHQAKHPKLGMDVLVQGTGNKRPATEMNGNMFGDLDSYSATSALDNFMEARGKKKPKLTGSDYFSATKHTTTPKEHQMLPAPAPPAVTVVKNIQLPLPTVNPPSNPSPFIVSTTLMQIRPIIKTITSLYSSAQIIERDFSKHNESSWQRGTVRRSPVVSPLASEADIILSPSIGVIMTTLAKIKQKPLPGQKTKAKHLERIEAVAQRYARIIVFVSEGSADDSTRNLNGHDSMAYAEFIGFCSTLDCAVTPIYVPGGPNALGTWMASAMVQHGIHDGSQASLMEDETIWELFLRRCGMNAYAAQSVIATMRAPDGVNSSSPNKAGMFGLPGFVQMDHAERVRLFGTLLGGTKVLERVSTAIDTPWRPPTPMMAPNFAPAPPYGNTARGLAFL